MASPAASIVVTADYGSGDTVAWNDLRRCLGALTRQDFTEPFEVLLVETREWLPRVPTDLSSLLPGLRIIGADGPSANRLKNAGVREARSEIIGLLDADCAADPGWVRSLVEAMRSHPDVAVVSGRTSYGTRTRLDRLMALIARSFVDRGSEGPTRHVTINNAGFHRQVLLDHPLPEKTGAHSSMLQSEPLAKTGARFWFSPGMHVIHSYEGWKMERQIRASMGYGVIQVRQLDPRIRYARLARLGFLSVPLFVVLRTLHSWVNCMRNARHYNVAWYELPLAFVLAAVSCSMEIPGMVRAVSGRKHPTTEFR